MARPATLIVGKIKVKDLDSTEAGFVQSVRAVMGELENNLEYILTQFEDATPDLMYDALEPTYNKTQEYCPERTGALKNSGYLEMARFRGNPRVELGYGKGGLPEYTVYVHEMVEIPHKEPTRAKWVEVAVNEDTFEIIERISQGYKRFMGV